MDHLEIFERIPQVPVTLIEGTHRWNVIDGLPPQGSLGIELGVAGGSFSARMVASGKFAKFFGVDVYGDRHDIREYRKALNHVGILANYQLLRMTFEEALELFPDAFFDFIYIDGYAHTGEEGGRTLCDWYPKLKPGGILAGDDYDAEKWPLVIWAVHHLAARLGVGVSVTDQVGDDSYNRYASWFMTKPLQGPARVEPCAELVALGEAAKAARAGRQAKR